MASAAPDRLRWIAPLAVILALIGGFFWGSRNPYIPHGNHDSPGLEESIYAEPQVEVWLSHDKFFVWDEETVRPLEELPARIREYKIKHSLRCAAVACDPLVRLEDTVYALGELRKAGFSSVTVITRSKSEPKPERYWWRW